MTPLLEVDGLSIRYATDRGPVHALSDLHLTIEEGAALGVVGESGSGKSTLALAILGLLGNEAAAPAGRILFRGADLLALSSEERRRLRGSKIGMVFQDPFTALNPALTIGEQIGEPLVYHRGATRAAALAAAVRLLDEVGIANAAAVGRSYPHQLSGGMKQRAMIATALSCEPDLLILDEPTTALDVTIEAQILDLLEELRRRRRLSLLFISHNLGVVRRVCDRVAVLYAGQLLEEGASGELFARPAHPYTKGLLASLPRIRERHRPLAPIPGRFPDLTRLPAGCVFEDRCIFAEDECGQAQTLVAGSDGRQVRCWKHDAVIDRKWHGPEAKVPAGASAPKADGAMPVDAVNLRKDFRLGGLLAGLSLSLSHGLRFDRSALAVRALDGVSVAVGPGEILGLVGESGSGKSTLGRVLLRLVEPDAGTIRIDGTDITRLRQTALAPTRRVAQIVFQNPDSSLNPRKSVGDLIGRPLIRFGLAKPGEVGARVAHLLDIVQLPASYATRFPHQMSGGEKQRVCIARAIASDPKFIVCDEPVSSLDVSVQAAILNLLRELRDRLHVAYLFISHDLSVIAHIADRVAVMYRGAICEEGAIDDVLRPPYHPYTEALLSAAPKIDAAAGHLQRVRLRGDPVEAGPIRGCRFHHRCPRKIGTVCEDVPPSVLEPAAGHRIACHLPLATLAAIPPVV